MTKKLTRLEAFQELSIQLARIEDKLDKLLEQNKPKEIKLSQLIKNVPDFGFDDAKKIFDDLVPEGSEVDVGCEDIWQVPKEWQVEIKPKINPDPSYFQCYFDMHPEDRFKPISVSCPCRRCSPCSMSSGSIQSVGTDTWTNTITGKLQE